jgi:hypothetical protein
MPALVESVMTLIAAAMGASSISFFGPQKDAQYGTPPRINWVTGSEVDEQIQYKAPRQREAATKHSAAEEWIPVDVHVWGVDQADAETRSHALIAAMSNELSNIAFEMRRTKASGDKQLKNGYVKTVGVFLKFPVINETRTTVDLETAEMTGKMTNATGGSPETGVP